jgi:GTP-binding protein HflX
MLTTTPNAERAGLVGCFFRPRDRALAEESLEELAALAHAAGAAVVERTLQERRAPDAAYFVGRGKAEELREQVEDMSLDLLVFDEELSPAQQRNLESKCECKILDRTQLILDIFARRARTREGKLQVELAQLNYLLPRLSGKGTMLSRLGAGIGTRGPGETKLEMDRRRIRNRIAALRRDLEKVAMQRGRQRAKRHGIPVPVVALVGYTNAGKSTLFNALTRAKTLESPQLFATLDPLLRRLALPGGLEIILSDTVGFVRKLPHEIVAAFRATLEEVKEADLLLHVVDASSLLWAEQKAAVEEVLKELGVESTPVIEVFNKMDLLDAADSPLAPSDSRERVAVSALQRSGVDALLLMIRDALESFLVRLQIKIPYSDGALLARVSEHGRILSRADETDGVALEVQLPRAVARSLGKYVKAPYKPQ